MQSQGLLNIEVSAGYGKKDKMVAITLQNTIVTNKNKWNFNHIIPVAIFDHFERSQDFQRFQPEMEDEIVAQELPGIYVIFDLQL